MAEATQSCIAGFAYRRDAVAALRTEERAFLGGLAPKPGNITPAHATRGLLVSRVLGCRPSFPMATSGRGKRLVGKDIP